MTTSISIKKVLVGVAAAALLASPLFALADKASDLRKEAEDKLARIAKEGELMDQAVRNNINQRLIAIAKELEKLERGGGGGGGGAGGGKPPVKPPALYDLETDYKDIQNIENNFGFRDELEKCAAHGNAAAFFGAAGRGKEANESRQKEVDCLRALRRNSKFKGIWSSLDIKMRNVSGPVYAGENVFLSLAAVSRQKKQENGNQQPKQQKVSTTKAPSISEMIAAINVAGEAAKSPQNTDTRTIQKNIVGAIADVNRTSQPGKGIQAKITDLNSALGRLKIAQGLNEKHKDKDGNVENSALDEALQKAIKLIEDAIKALEAQLRVRTSSANGFKLSVVTGLDAKTKKGNVQVVLTGVTSKLLPLQLKFINSKTGTHILTVPVPRTACGASAKGSATVTCKVTRPFTKATKQVATGDVRVEFVGAKGKVEGTIMLHNGKPVTSRPSFEESPYFPGEKPKPVEFPLSPEEKQKTGPGLPGVTNGQQKKAPLIEFPVSPEEKQKTEPGGLPGITPSNGQSATQGTGGTPEPGAAFTWRIVNGVAVTTCSPDYHAVCDREPVPQGTPACDINTPRPNYTSHATAPACEGSTVCHVGTGNRASCD